MFSENFQRLKECIFHKAFMHRKKNHFTLHAEQTFSSTLPRFVTVEITKPLIFIRKLHQIRAFTLSSEPQIHSPTLCDPVTQRDFSIVMETNYTKNEHVSLMLSKLI
jgi:hypothetical protein